MSQAQGCQGCVKDGALFSFSDFINVIRGLGGFRFFGTASAIPNWHNHMGASRCNLKEHDDRHGQY